MPSSQSLTATIIAASVLASGCGGHDDGSTVAAKWAHVIPANFPLLTGLPSADASGKPVRRIKVPGLPRINACQQSMVITRAVSDSGSGDVAGVVYDRPTSGPYQRRSLALLSDDAAAHQLFENLSDSVSTCHVIQSINGGGGSPSVAVTPSSFGDESTAAVVDSGEYGEVVYRIVRTGNAVLVTSAIGGADAAAATEQDEARLVAAIAVFART